MERNKLFGFPSGNTADVISRPGIRGFIRISDCQCGKKLAFRVKPCCQLFKGKENITDPQASQPKFTGGKSHILDCGSNRLGIADFRNTVFFCQRARQVKASSIGDEDRNRSLSHNFKGTARTVQMGAAVRQKWIHFFS